MRIRYRFDLTEIIIVVAIIAILAAVAAPYYIQYVKKAEEKVCKSNCIQLERMYEIYLYDEAIKHSDIVFQKFLQQYSNNICPKYGEVNYMDGEVKCSMHFEDDTIKDIDDEDVPFL